MWSIILSFKIMTQIYTCMSHFMTYFQSCLWFIRCLVYHKMSNYNIVPMRKYKIFITICSTVRFLRMHRGDKWGRAIPVLWALLGLDLRWKDKMPPCEYLTACVSQFWNVETRICFKFNLERPGSGPPLWHKLLSLLLSRRLLVSWRCHLPYWTLKHTLACPTLYFSLAFLQNAYQCCVIYRGRLQIVRLK